MLVDHEDQTARAKSDARWFYISVSILLGIAACARLIYLSDFPSYIHNDESGIAVFVVPPFLQMPPQSPLWGFTFYGGHGNFDGFLSSIPALVTGANNLWTLRLGSAISGIVSIALFAQATRIALGCRIALFFIAAVAPFHIHVHYSRTGFTYIHAVLLTSALAYAFARFAQRPTVSRAFLVGLCLGFALMVYSATYVLPAAVAVGFVIASLSLEFKSLYPRRRVLGTTKVLASVGGGLLCALGPQLVYVYRQGFTSASRLHSQALWSGTLANRDIDTLIAEVERYWSHFIRTLQFFYLRDGAVQGSGPLLTNACYQAIVAIGLLVMLYYLMRGSAYVWFLVAAGVFTIIGSAFMVEANFSPHLIIFSVLTPFACALAIDAFCRVVKVRSSLASFILAVVCMVPWAMWNYHQMQDVDQKKSSLITWFLRLPINREEVLQVVNISHYYADVGESMYRVMYPKAKMSTMPSEDQVRQMQMLITTAACPCVALIDNEWADEVSAFLQGQNRSYDTFTHEKRFGVAFLVR